MSLKVFAILVAMMLVFISWTASPALSSAPMGEGGYASS